LNRQKKTESAISGVLGAPAQQHGGVPDLRLPDRWRRGGGAFAFLDDDYFERLLEKIREIRLSERLLGDFFLLIVVGVIGKFHGAHFAFRL
jgi:hypothetical protein